MKKTLSLVLIIVFTAFITCVGMLYVLMPKSDYSSTEKRYLSRLPSLSYESVKEGSFSTEFESFLADQTPCRKFFVSLNAYFELIKGNNGSNGVYLGKDGWLIEKPFERDNRFSVNMKKIASFCDKIDVPSAVVAVPVKGAVYKEKLPTNALEYCDYSMIDSVPGYLGNKAVFIDVRNLFESKKNETQLFYKTDHHWTSDATFLTYRLICNSLDLQPTDDKNYAVSEYDGFFGTSYSTSCYTLTKPDSLKIYRNVKTENSVSVTVSEGAEDKHYSSMFFDNRLSEDDMYTAFLDGNHGLVEIETQNDGPSLLVIKDSFAHCLVPFLADNYSRIVMIDLRYYKKSVYDLVSESSFDQVLFVYGMDSLATSRDIILK